MLLQMLDMVVGLCGMLTSGVTVIVAVANAIIAVQMIVDAVMLSMEMMRVIMMVMVCPNRAAMMSQTRW